jgi:hypothetical protein
MGSVGRLGVTLVSLTGLISACSQQPSAEAVTTTVTETATTGPGAADPSPDAPPGTADFPSVASGTRLRLKVIPVRADDFDAIGPCRVHLYDGTAAYISKCERVSDVIEKELVFFQVKLTNPTDSPVKFSLENFLIVSRSEGYSYDPVDVRSDWRNDPFLLPAQGLIPPKANRAGWLTFDGRIEPDFGAAGSLVYVDGDEAVTVAFAGKPKSRVMPTR